MLRFLVTLASALMLGACATEREDGTAIGGNLFLEPTPGGDYILVLDGEINLSTLYAFQTFIEQTEVPALIIKQSPGGDVLVAHEMGRAVQEKGMSTVVLKECISACVDLFVAGKNREMASTATLALHGGTYPEMTFFVDRRYWSALGLSGVNEGAYLVPEGGLWVVPAERAKELRLATRILGTDS